MYNNFYETTLINWSNRLTSKYAHTDTLVCEPKTET